MEIMGRFGILWDHLGPFDNFESFDTFGAHSDVLGRLGTFWDILGHIGTFWIFWDHLGSFETF